MGGDVETSANSAFTTGSIRHAITDKYEMQDGNAKQKEGSGSHDRHARAQEEETSVSANDDADDAYTDDNTPSARMVDPRAATVAAANARVSSQASAAKLESEEQQARPSANVEHGAASGGLVRAAVEGGVTAEEVGFGTVRTREEAKSSVGVDDKRVVGDGNGGGDDASERNGKRARSEGMGIGKETERAGDYCGEPPRGEEAVAEEEETGLTEEERNAAAELERLERAAAAKAKKEAAVKAARERFLARRKA